jgi:hypothetical protein
MLALFGTAHVANEYPIIEQKQTSCVLAFRCRHDLQAGRRARPVVVVAIEMI